MRPAVELSGRIAGHHIKAIPWKHHGNSRSHTSKAKYPLTTRVLRHMHKYRYMPQHNAFAVKIFGLAVRFETGVDLNKLPTLAQIVELSGNLELATGENPPNAETVNGRRFG